MITSERAWRRVALLAAVLTAVAVGIAPPASATDDAHALRIGRVGGLHASGAGVAVEVEARCAPAAVEGGIQVQITQVTDTGAVVDAFGRASTRCTGEVEHIEVGVAAYAPFEVGLAFVSADLDVCGGTGCSRQTATRTIHIRAGGQDSASFDSALVTVGLPRRGTIEVDGAGVVVQVSYTCEVGVETPFDASLGQVDGDGVNVMYAPLTLHCTGQRRSGTLAFHTSGPAWVGGAAFIMINGDACSDSDCTAAYAFRTIHLV